MGSNKEKTANDKKRSRKDAKLKKRTVLLGSLFTAILLSVSFFIYGSHVKLNNSALLSYTLLFAVFGSLCRGGWEKSRPPRDFFAFFRIFFNGFTFRVNF